MKIKRSPITYWGGKAKAISTILPYFPPVTSKLIYIEPFLGSGVVALNYAPRWCILNDKNDLIYYLFRFLSGAKFKRLMDEYPRSEYYHVWQEKAMEYDAFVTELSTIIPGKAVFDEYNRRTDAMGRVIAFFILNRNNFSGANRKEFQKILSTRPFVAFDDIVKFFGDSARRVRLWNYDFRKVVKAANKWRDKTRTHFLYLDPPYPSQKASEGAYGESMTENDHRELMELLDVCPHQWIMSNEDTEFVRSLYDGFYTKEVGWSYSGQKHHKTDGTTELLISNKPLVKTCSNKSGTIDKFLKHLKKVDNFLSRKCL